MYAKYARTARKTLQKMLTIKEITSIIMHHLPSIQIEDCGSVDLTAYRFRYALNFLLYHTTRKMSNHSFRCFCKNKYDLSAVCQAKTDLTNQRKCTRKESLPVQQTICSHAKGSKKTPDNAGVFFCPVKKAAAGQFVFKDSP